MTDTTYWEGKYALLSTQISTRHVPFRLREKRVGLTPPQTTTNVGAQLVIEFRELDLCIGHLYQQGIRGVSCYVMLVRTRSSSYENTIYRLDTNGLKLVWGS